jgi:hypothetical protein
MWITLLSGARSGDVHATTNSPPLTIDRVNIAHSDPRLLTLNFNGITKTTTLESAILREDHLVFVALPKDLHAYVLEKKRRFAPDTPLLLPSTKFSPSHLYKHCAVRLVCDLLAELRITKFHVLRDIFAKHLSALNPRHTSATQCTYSPLEVPFKGTFPYGRSLMDPIHHSLARSPYGKKWIFPLWNVLSYEQHCFVHNLRSALPGQVFYRWALDV